jgi:hypothetical protein
MLEPVQVVVTVLVAVTLVVVVVTLPLIVVVVVMVVTTIAATGWTSCVAVVVLGAAVVLTVEVLTEPITVVRLEYGVVPDVAAVYPKSEATATKASTPDISKTLMTFMASE